MNFNPGFKVLLFALLASLSIAVPYSILPLSTFGAYLFHVPFNILGFLVGILAIKKGITVLRERSLGKGILPTTSLITGGLIAFVAVLYAVLTLCFTIPISLMF